MTIAKDDRGKALAVRASAFRFVLFVEEERRRLKEAGVLGDGCSLGVTVGIHGMPVNVFGRLNAKRTTTCPVGDHEYGQATLFNEEGIDIVAFSETWPAPREPVEVGR